MPTPEYYYAHTCPTSPSGQTYLVPRDDVDAMDAKFGHTNGVGLLIRQGQGIIDVVSIDRSQSVPSPNSDGILMVDDSDCQAVRDKYL